MIMAQPLDVLILEDRQTDTELMLHELKRAGFEPHWACVETRADYLEHLGGDWDVILADYSLPQYDALQALQDLHNLNLDIPFIIVTGTVSEEIAVECMKQGATDYLLKDRLRRLGSAVKRAIDEKILRVEREHAEKLIQESELRYRTIFETAAVSIWEEDFSAIKVAVDDLQKQGVKDFSKYFDEHPEFLTELIQNIKVLDVNEQTLKMFGAHTKDELLGSIDKIALPETSGIIRDEIIAIAEGQTYFEGETVNQTLKGERINVLLTMKFPQEDGRFDSVLVSIMDITERHHLEQRSQRLLQQQTAANQLALSLGESLELADIYQIIYQHVSGLMDTDAFIISSYDNATQLVQTNYVIADGVCLDVIKFPSLPIEEQGDATQSQVICSGNPLNIADYRVAMQNTVTKHTLTDDKRVVDGASPENQAKESINSAILVPMKAKGETIGVLQIQSYLLDAYTQEDVDLLAALANVAAIAIQNARLFKEAHQRLNELETVSRISVALRSANKLAEILPIFLDETLSILKTSSGAIAIYDEITNQFETHIYRGWFRNMKSHLPPIRKGISGQVLRTGKTHFIADYASDPLVSPETQHLIPAKWGGACFPIHAGDLVTGIYYISVEHPRQLSNEEIILLETLADLLGVAIQRTRLREKAQKQIQRLAALRAIDTTINASLNMNTIANVLLEQTKALLDVDAVRLMTLDRYTNFLENSGCVGFQGDIQQQMRMRIGESWAGKTALRREITLIPNLASKRELLEDSDYLAEEDFAAYFAIPLISKGQIKGVLEALHRTPLYPDQDWIDFFKTLAGQAALAIDNTSLFRDLQKSNLDLALAYDSTLEGWSRALEYRDSETKGHPRRVVDLTVKIAQEMGISDQELVHVRRGTLLHDIGKMGIPDHILQKRGPLDEKEWEIMRTHPVHAFEMLAPIDYLRPALDIPRYHHEKWDGSGYPSGLIGDQIPLAARIFAIVDVWNALLSDRPYRKAWEEEKVIDYLRAQSGKHFDPRVVDAFFELMKLIE